ncbi:MAG TPA: 1-phosphofructokinase family hexose kinase [Gemmatimonadales bacterium]|nr:1-phosphofructokinase family hexose kinase [Gemmatimonadales bacterium]
MIAPGSGGPPGQPGAPVPGPIGILTLNPSLDVSYEVTRLVPGEKTVARHTRYDPGGNGINLGRMLKILGVPAETFCLMAGEIGALLRRLLASELDALHSVEIPGETRINCAVLQADPRIQYEVTASGAAVPSAALAEIESGLLRAASGGIGVLTGSLPPGVPAGTYARLVRLLHERGALAVVDAHPEFLAGAVAARPFLIKPNRYELSRLSGTSLESREDVLRVAAEVQRSGVEWVCVSLGAEGAVLVGSDESFSAVPPRLAIRSTVGSGDAMLAGLVAGFARGHPPAEVLRTAVACGSGTATTEGTRMCSLAEVHRIAGLVEVRRSGLGQVRVSGPAPAGTPAIDPGTTPA